MVYVMCILLDEARGFSVTHTHSKHSIIGLDLDVVCSIVAHLSVNLWRSKNIALTMKEYLFVTAEGKRLIKFFHLSLS